MNTIMKRDFIEKIEEKIILINSGIYDLKSTQDLMKKAISTGNSMIIFNISKFYDMQHRISTDAGIPMLKKTLHFLKEGEAI